MISKDTIYQHLIAQYNSALPVWVDKESFVLAAIRDAVTDVLADIIAEHLENSDFFESSKAKMFKQDDYSLVENTGDIDEYFSQKFKVLFRRGTRASIEELRRLFRSAEELLYYDTELYFDKWLGFGGDFRIADSSTVLSGWIADETYPTINSKELDELPEGVDDNQYVFTDKHFIHVTGTNSTDMSKDQLSKFIKHFILPFSIVSIIDFNN